MNGVFDRVYVINLDRSPDRLAQMQEKLRALGVRFTRMSAVDGAKLSEDALHDSKVCTPMCAKFSSKGAIGCALSHRNVWHDVVRNGFRSVLVLEDDANFAERDFHARFTQAWRAVPRDWEVVKIGASSSNGDRERYDTFDWFTTAFRGGGGGKRIGAGTRVNAHIVVPDTSTGTHCYAINFAGARKMLRASQPLAFPAHVDLLMSLGVQDLKLYGFADPLLVTQPHQASGSLIGTSSLPRLGNYVGDRVHLNANGVTFGWMMNEPLARVGNHVHLTGWRALWFLLGFLLGPSRWPLFALALFADEFVIGRRKRPNLQQLLFDVALFTAGAALRYTPKKLH